jgi:hypothetical protein
VSPVEAECSDGLWREWRQVVTEWDGIPDEDYRAKNRLYNRRAAIERRLVATEEGRASLASSIDDIDEVVRLCAATALLPHGIPDARRELERLRAAGSAKTALSASLILDEHNQRLA